MAAPKKHYRMFSAQVEFHHKDDKNESVTGIMVNGVIDTDLNILTAKDLGRMQQIAQMALFKRIGPENTQKVNVLNVTLVGAFYCGYMTNAQFIATPEGKKLQEKAPEEPAAAPRPVADEFEPPADQPS